MDAGPTFSMPLRALCVLAFAFTVGYIFLHDPPEEITRLVWDKAIHFTVYGGLAFLLWVAAEGRGPGVAWAVVTAIGALDEIHQSYTPNRTADLDDLAADALGALAVLLVLRAIERRRRLLSTAP